MTYGRVILVAILAAVTAACGASTTPSPTHVAGAASARPTTSPTMSTAPTKSQRSVSRSPDRPPVRTPTPIPPPAKPAGLEFDTTWVEHPHELFDFTQSVRWRTPQGKGVEVRVYGVTECIARPARPSPDTRGPCLVVGTPLPASVRTLLGTAPASEGVVSWSWSEEVGCSPGIPHDPGTPEYHAVVLAAYNASGHSIFTIAEPGEWWEPGPDDIIC